AANVITRLQKPTLVLAHNKTLAAQLYKEFKGFFPHNAVHYFISYYDYYQPEAYIPQRDIYIEKDASINENIDRLRLAATSALVSGEVDALSVIHPLTGETIKVLEELYIYPAKHFVTPEERVREAIKGIEQELDERLEQFKNEGKLLEAERLKARCRYDLDMLREA